MCMVALEKAVSPPHPTPPLSELKTASLYLFGRFREMHVSGLHFCVAVAVIGDHCRELGGCRLHVIFSC